MHDRVKVYIGCFGSGLGHARRMLEVAEELIDRGDEVEFSSSGEVAGLIEKSGYHCNRLPLADVRYTESGGFSMKNTLASTPSLLLRTYRQVAEEVANIARFGPAATLSDSSLSTLLASRALRVPAFTVLNQLNLGGSIDGEGSPKRLLSFGTSTGMGRLWELSKVVFLPDLPPPYTISERNLWGSNVSKTRYVGFLGVSGRAEPDEAGIEFVADPRPKVFWQVSGPPRTRTAMVKTALEFASELSDRYVFVVSGGSPGSSSEASRVSGGWSYGWCRIPEFYFSSADIIASRAGHGTICQSIMAGKPSLLIPIPNQPEQLGNAEKAERLGISIALEQEGLSLGLVDGAFRSLLEGRISENVSRLSAYASQFDAKREIWMAIDSATSDRR